MLLLMGQGTRSLTGSELSRGTSAAGHGARGEGGPQGRLGVLMLVRRGALQGASLLSLPSLTAL